MKEKEVIFVLSDSCNASHAPISCNIKSIIFNQILFCLCHIIQEPIL